MFRILSSVFLGWALGSNDSANVFGTAVSSRMLRFSTAAFLTALFVILGALIQGHEGLKTIFGLTTQTTNTAFIVSLAAACTVTLMTFLKLPISTSQAVVGAILGIGLKQHQLNTDSLTKIILCWIGTPLGGILFCFFFYFLFRAIIRIISPNIFMYDTLIRAGLIVAGCYGAYALGANNVANIAGVYVGTLLSPTSAIILGAVSIALGTITYSKNVMTTVGKSIVKLDGFSALVAVVAHAVTVHIFAIIGVPVSTSQAIVGAVLAIGIIKGIQTINGIQLLKIILAWLFTPVAGLLFSLLFYYLMCTIKF